jgi:hypothetical protein
MHIQINTEQPLTEIDLAVLRALAGTTATEALPREVIEEAPKKRTTRKPKVVEAPEEQEVAKVKAWPELSRAEEAKARAEAEQQDAEKMAKQAVEEPPAKLVSVPDPEPVVEPLPSPKDLIEDAATRATQLIRSGKRDKVKGILDGMGLEKVTALKDNPEKVQDFLDRISELEG